MIKQILLVGLGGGIGSIFRFLSSHYIHKLVKGNFPWATFTVNLIGCFLIGLFAAWLAKHNYPNETLKWLFITGFCGGYTTFSAFAIENIYLFQQQQYYTLAAYTLGSLILGFLAVAFGLILIK